MVTPSPNRIEPTGDDTPAATLYGYVWRMSGGHQGGLSLVAIVVAALSMAPLELQRRIVNDAIGGSDVRLLAILGVLYLAVVLLQAGLKFFLHLYQGWVGESAIRYTRLHLARLNAEHRRAEATPGDNGGGRAVSIIGGEVEKLGGFVGESVSEPLVSAGTLAAILGYMLVMEPLLALISLAFLAPQAIAAPLIQRLVNRLVERRVGLLRDMGELVAAETGQESGRQSGDADYGPSLESIYRNRIKIYFWKFAGKGATNLMNNLASLSALVVGGYLVIRGETTLGVVVAFVSGFDRLIDPSRQLLTFYRIMEQTRIQHRMIARWM